MLGAGARAQIFRDRMNLVRGSAQIQPADRYALEAGGLRVVASASGSSVSVATTGGGIRVGTLIGQASVVNASGSVIARIPAGTSLAFDGAGAGAPKTMQVTGKVVKENGKFYLVDKTTGLKVQLTGSDDFAKLVGHTLQVTGDIVTVDPAPGVAYVITVTGTHTLAGAGVVTGLSAGTKAVIAGVAIAGAGAATAIIKTHESGSSLSQ